MRSFRRILEKKNAGWRFQDLLETSFFIIKHPLNAALCDKIGTFWRYFSWQIQSRLRPGPSLIDFVGHTKLLVKRGVAQRRICYMPLNKFEEMCFLVHALRKDDYFVDIGANIGAYTVLASAVVGARTIACEPLPANYALLRENVRLNPVESRVEALNVGVAGVDGTKQFSSCFGAKDHVVCPSEDIERGKRLELPVRTLDSLAKDRSPTLIKVDVEGLETEVIGGGAEVMKKDCLHAVIIELKGHGAKYGYDESVLMDRIAGFGFKAFRYSPLDRRVLSSGPADTGSDNRIYLRDPDWARKRVQDHPGFHIGSKTL